MLGPYMLLFRQARNTAFALETLLFRQGLYYSNPGPKVMPELRTLLWLPAEITLVWMETLKGRQTLYAYRGMPDTRTLP